MQHRKTLFGQMLGCALVAGAFFGAASAAHASVINNAAVTPMITSGALPDSPDNRIDLNVSSSPFSGVVSIFIENSSGGFICSGALVSKRSVVSAGHCIDTDGNGTLPDLSSPENRVHVVFNSDGAGNAIVQASSVSMDAGYRGFGNCPVGVPGFCVNDDIAVITLGEDAPASAKIYKVAANPVTSGQHIIMAGYGTSGDGVNGFNVAPDFFIKRTGENYIDLIEADDETNGGGRNEVYYADFDGGGIDGFCDYLGVCSPVLPNDREAGIGGGDSGGPAFIEMYGELMLVANNTFVGNFVNEADGAFGSYFGGIILGSYADYLYGATGGRIQLVAEPTSIALFGMGALVLLGARRRSKKAA